MGIWLTVWSNPDPHTPSQSISISLMRLVTAGMGRVARTKAIGNSMSVPVVGTVISTIIYAEWYKELNKPFPEEVN